MLTDSKLVTQLICSDEVSVDDIHKYLETHWPPCNQIDDIKLAACLYYLYFNKRIDPSVDSILVNYETKVLHLSRQFKWCHAIIWA